MADHFRTGLDWEDVRVFLALARFGSLSAAARSLGVSHATVARRLSELERTLSCSLMERRPHGYVMTPAGERVLEAAGDMESAAERVFRGGTADVLAGLVRINATPSLTDGFIAGHLAALSLRHPALDIEVATDHRSVSLQRHEADIALRLERPRDGHVIARKLVTLAFRFYGVPAWQERLAGGEPPVFVGFDEGNQHVPEAQWLKGAFPHGRLAFRSTTQLGQAGAAGSGVGIALLPRFVGANRPDLVPLDLSVTPPERGVWLLARRESFTSAAVRAVAEFLTALFDEQRHVFEER